jgi:hypothetical protein
LELDPNCNFKIHAEINGGGRKMNRCVKNEIPVSRGGLRVLRFNDIRCHAHSMSRKQLSDHGSISGNLKANINWPDDTKSREHSQLDILLQSKQGPPPLSEQNSFNS